MSNNIELECGIKKTYLDSKKCTMMVESDNKIEIYACEFDDGPYKLCVSLTKNKINYLFRDFVTYFMRYIDNDGEKILIEKLENMYGLFFFKENKNFSYLIRHHYDDFFFSIKYGYYNDLISMELPDIPEGRENGGAYVSTIENKECVRMFVKCYQYLNETPIEGVKYAETLRIFIDDKGNYQLYRNAVIGWKEIDINCIEVHEMETKIIGRKPRYYEKCETVLELMLSLYNKGWDNAINLGYSYLIQYIHDYYLYENIEIDYLDEYIDCNLTVKLDRNANSFAKMYGIPQWMLDKVMTLEDETDKEVALHMIRELSYVLEDNTNPNYFLGIDEKSFNKALDETIRLVDEGKLNNILYILKYDLIYRRLCFEMGANNWLEKYIYTLNIPYDLQIDYIDYIEMACDLNIYTWKIPYDSIESQHNEITLLYNADAEKMLDSKYETDFNERKNEWNKLLYTSDLFSITIPDKPTDLIREGLILNHCVKSYIPKIAAGETIILFIRKNSDIDTPFYTLEVRNNEIRQCHGKYNCDMDEEVSKFVSSFCKAKNIHYTTGAALLAAD